MNKFIRKISGNNLFKSLTWFDFMTFGILSLIILSASLFFYRKGEFVTIRVKVTDQNVLYAWNNPQNWYANRFQVGYIEKNTLGEVISEIIGVDSFNVESKNKAVYLDLRVKAVYDSRTKLYSARGKQLVFGTPVRFNFSEITFDGIVVEFPNSEFQKDLNVKNSKVSALVRGFKTDGKLIESVEPQVLEKLRVGDKIVSSNGTVLVEIIDVKTYPAQRTIQNERGDLLLRYDPIYKDALITLNFLTKEFNGESYIFDDIPLRVGDEIPLVFKDLVVEPVIVDILP